MTLLLVFLGSVFTAFALYLTVAPFLGGKRAGARLEHLSEEINEIEQLVARRQVLLGSLRELEFELETEKVAPQDYKRFRARYETEAVAIMRRLDEIHGGRGWEARIDAELEKRLGRKARHVLEAEQHEEGPDEEAAGDEIASEADEDAAEDVAENIGVEEVSSPTPDEELTNANGEREEEAGVAEPMSLQLTCANCDEPLEQDDRFCSQCGTPVEPLESEESDKREASA